MIDLDQELRKLREWRDLAPPTACCSVHWSVINYLLSHTTTAAYTPKTTKDQRAILLTSVYGSSRFEDMRAVLEDLARAETALRGDR